MRGPRGERPPHRAPVATVLILTQACNEPRKLKIFGPLADSLHEKEADLRRLVRSMGGLVCLALAAGALACNRVPEEDPRLRQALLALDVAALGPLLDTAATLAGTPLAREAAALRLRLEGCALAGFVLEKAPPADSFPSPACLDDVDERQRSRLDFARARMEGREGLLLWPVGQTGRLELSFTTTDDGDLDLEGFLRPSGDDTLDLLVPSSEPPARPVLRASDAFAYARLRPAGGLRLARLLPEGGQADRMFALKGRLLEGALLSGTVELAFLPPRGDVDMPLAIGALHHRGAGPIGAALAEALDQLEATWPIQRTPKRFPLAHAGLQDGACFESLPLLPGLAPCWVVTPDALVIAWREAAIVSALGPPDVASAPSGAAGEHALTVDLARIARDDRSRPGANPNAPHTGDLFSRLTLDLAPADGGVRLHARFAKETR